jgi:nucleoside-diphosphate-sugar epimerase
LVIVGHGLLAKAFAGFEHTERVLVYAAGVSDSLETDPAAFERERKLLETARAQHPERLLVYFGTCSADDPDRRETPYVTHKLEMERVLEQHPAPWMVLRLPLAIGPVRGGHTLAPFLYERISRGERFQVWQHATRYPIDVQDVVRIAARLIPNRAHWNRKINVALRAYSILDFVRTMESIVGRPAIYELVPKGRHYEIRCPEVEALVEELALEADEGYLDRVLRKYFAAT